MKTLIKTVLGLVLAMSLTSCVQEVYECEIYELGYAGEYYEAIHTRPGELSTIYVDRGIVYQEICY